MRHHFFVFLICISWQETFSQQFSSVRFSISIDQYVDSVYQQTDRQYYPLTADMCMHDDGYKHLRSCNLYVHNQQMLTAYSQRFLNPQTSSWARSSSKDTMKDVRQYYHSIFAQSPTHSYTYYPSSMYVLRRGKRSVTAENEAIKMQRGEKVLQRSKRDIPGNPCVKGMEKRTVIFHALDAYDETPRELLQDPKNKLYQSFYTRECHKQRFNLYDCEVTYVTHLAAVFDDQGDVITRPVRIPSACAMTVK